ncbi:MAG: DUF3365 domain-containing protein [Clostridia bacterium]|jgi:two-component system sensor histidine kinase BarA|nr:DUF3365 domain-containing protein [Clostridia bacterium]
MSRQNLSYRFMLATTITIVIVMLANFLWEYHQQQRQAYMELQEKAGVITLQLLATREFIARNQDRINYDAHGHFEFKGLNPAAVGTGTSEIFGQWTDYKIKQTRFGARNPLNRPDEFEMAALQSFSRNPHLQEVWDQQIINGKHYFRYMIPLYANESCLPCHGEPAGCIDIAGYPREGYRLGDLAGAISVLMPMDIFITNLRSNTYRHFGFTLVLLGLCLSSIYLLLNRLVTNPLSRLKEAAVQVGQGDLNVDLRGIDARGEIKELAVQFQDMADQLRELYSNLEGQVEKRTEELTVANRELKEKQEALEAANRELSILNRHKSQFLATMSHELRTPLTSIIAFAELLQQQLPEDDQTNLQNVEEIRTNGENLLVLINDLLDLAQIEAGRYQLRPETMDLVDVIDSVERVIAPLAMQKNIDFSTEFLREVPLVKADPEKIRRAVLNLAGNAIKFTPEGGQVKIAVDFDQEAQQILVMVSDTGIGIKEEDLAYIFERFRQVDSSNVRRYRGSGLGLALTKELMEMHGGWVGVTSEPNKGSTFTLGLPLGWSQGEDGDEEKDNFVGG